MHGEEIVGPSKHTLFFSHLESEICRLVSRKILNMSNFPGYLEFPPKPSLHSCTCNINKGEALGCLDGRSERRAHSGCSQDYRGFRQLLGWAYSDHGMWPLEYQTLVLRLGPDRTLEKTK